MFRKKEPERKKRSGFLPFVILRTTLSISMMLVLVVAVYQAYRYFSGVDPLKMDPKSLLAAVLSSDRSADTVSKILGLNLPKNLDDLKNIKQVLKEDESKEKSGGQQSVDPGPPLFKFAVLADSHKDNESLAKAVVLAKQQGAAFIIGLGDYSEVGTLEELQKAREAVGASGLPFYTTAGDHDLWDNRDKGVNPATHFTQVFGTPYQSFGYSDIRFVIVDNSDNYQGVDGVQMSWLESELQRVKLEDPKLSFLFVHEPLFHPSSDHVMGKVNPVLKDQAQKLASLAKEAGVSEVFAGDTHFFTRYTDPQSLLSMTTVGALTMERNTQTPRFALVEIFPNAGYNIREVEVR